MAKGKKGGGQKTRKGSGGRWSTPLFFALLGIPVFVLGALWGMQGGKLPALALPAVGFGSGTAPTATSVRVSSPAVAATPKIQPTTVPTRQASPTAVPTRAATATPAPTARATAASVPVAPTSTPAAKLILKVPIYHQEHALSCEASALRMALAAFGLQLPEDKLLGSLARDRTPRKVMEDGTVQWGDPDAGFVGAWDGVFLQDGYGVYEKPIAELAMAQGYEAVRYGKNVDPRQLYAAVREGFPSVVWMAYDLTVKGRGSWSTPAGKKVSYVVTEHAVVLAGIDTDGVYYADPMKPALQYVSFAAFEKAIAELEGRYVTVRP